MAVISYTNPMGALSTHPHALGGLYGTGVLNENGMTRLGTSRLFRDGNGFIQLVEKTPAEVVGEKVLLPLINRVSTLTSCICSFAQYLPSFPSLPVAHAEAAPVSGEIIHFPSQEALISCIDQHPLIAVTPYFSEKGVTEAIAAYFADEDKVPRGVDLGVILALHDLDKKLQLPSISLAILKRNLVEALKECASGDAIPAARSVDPAHKSDL